MLSFAGHLRELVCDDLGGRIDDPYAAMLQLVPAVPALYSWCRGFHVSCRVVLHSVFSAIVCCCYKKQTSTCLLFSLSLSRGGKCHLLGSKRLGRWSDRCLRHTFSLRWMRYIFWRRVRWCARGFQAGGDRGLACWGWYHFSSLYCMRIREPCSLSLARRIIQCRRCVPGTGRGTIFPIYYPRMFEKA